MTEGILRSIVVVSLIVLSCIPCAYAEVGKEEMAYLLDIADRATEYLDELFEEFGQGEIEANTALERLSILVNEYDKSVEPVPPEAEKLDELMMILFSRVENYFIYYKRADRENPEINLKLAEARVDLTREARRLQFRYL